MKKIVMMKVIRLNINKNSFKKMAKMKVIFNAVDTYGIMFDFS